MLTGTRGDGSFSVIEASVLQKVVDINSCMERGKTVVRNHNDVAVGFAFTAVPTSSIIRSTVLTVKPFPRRSGSAQSFLVLTPPIVFGSRKSVA